MVNIAWNCVRKREREIAEEDSRSPRKGVGSRPLGGFENRRKCVAELAESFRKENARV